MERLCRDWWDCRIASARHKHVSVEPCAVFAKDDREVREVQDRMSAKKSDVPITLATLDSHSLPKVLVEPRPTVDETLTFRRALSREFSEASLFDSGRSKRQLLPSLLLPLNALSRAIRTFGLAAYDNEDTCMYCMSPLIVFACVLCCVFCANISKCVLTVLTFVTCCGCVHMLWRSNCMCRAR